MAPVHLHSFSLSVSNTGRERKQLCSFYRDAAEGGTLWDPPATKMQLQSNADFCAGLVPLAGSRRGAGMTRVLDAEYCTSTTLVIHKVSFMPRTWEAFPSLWTWAFAGDESAQTHIDFQGRQADPRPHLKSGGVGLWTLHMVVPLHAYFWYFCKFTEGSCCLCLGSC